MFRTTDSKSRWASIGLPLLLGAAIALITAALFWIVEKYLY